MTVPGPVNWNENQIIKHIICKKYGILSLMLPSFLQWKEIFKFFVNVFLKCFLDEEIDSTLKSVAKYEATSASWLA